MVEYAVGRPADAAQRGDTGVSAAAFARSESNPSGPDLTKVDPRMIGPITDFMTFYVDSGWRTRLAS